MVSPKKVKSANVENVLQTENAFFSTLEKGKEFIMDYTGISITIPNNYEDINSYQVMFCPYCGAMNYVSLDWCGSIKGLTFCDRCGGEL